MPDLSPDSEFGPYRIVRLLGRGGMGAVYEAVERQDGRRVALKLLDQTLDTPDNHKRFLREGRLAASLNHPNSVYIYGTEEINGVPVIVMELVPGGTLEAKVQEGGAPGIRAALEAILQVTAGLEAAEQLGILHRDIKPSNCFLGADGTVKVGDFGLSISTARDSSRVTATGLFLGTPAFASPEQLLGEPLDLRSDLYAVGATLYYLLTARLPHEGEQVVQVIASALNRDPVPPTRYRPELPAAIEAIVLKCLSRKPADRYQSYAQLRHDLEAELPASAPAAPLSRRFAAGLVDVALILLLQSLLGVSLIRLVTAELGAVRLGAGSAAVLSLVLFVPYFTLTEGRYGASLGKLLFSLRVIRQGEGGRPGYGPALVRALLFAGMIVGLDLLDSRVLSRVLSPIASPEPQSCIRCGDGSAALSSPPCPRAKRPWERPASGPMPWWARLARNPRRAGGSAWTSGCVGRCGFTRCLRRVRRCRKRCSAWRDGGACAG